SYAAGLNPQAVAVANHDSNTVSVWLGQGNGAFQQGPAHEFATGAGPRSLTVGDFNGDARPDLATANEVGNSVSVLLGNGDGTFRAPQDLPLPRPHFYGQDRALAVVAGDVDANGKIDLVATSYDAYFGPYETYLQGYAHVLLGNGNGTFAAPVSYSLPAINPLGVALADLNADGKLDVVTANQEGTVSSL